MDRSAARDEVLRRALAVEDEQFEQLCKMLIERAEQTRDLELTPFRGDGGIDVHAVIDRDLFHASLGVQAKQYDPDRSVGPRTVRSFKGALSDQEYHIGTVITTASFTSGAVESAAQDDIRLIDGERLAEIMVDSGIGVLEAEDGGHEVDEAFWEAFETPEKHDVIPSLEVPQAGDFDVLRIVLRSVDAGSDLKPAIARFLAAETGEDWAPRQADYYGMAGWLLGFLHKEQRVEVDGHEVRRWGLTRAGEEYLTLLDQGSEDAARKQLHEAIRDVEIVSRIYDAVEREGTIERRGVADLVGEETELGGSTTDRRALTVGQWLDELPEIRKSGTGPSQRFEYFRENPDDFG